EVIESADPSDRVMQADGHARAEDRGAFARLAAHVDLARVDVDGWPQHPHARIGESLRRNDELRAGRREGGRHESAATGTRVQLLRWCAAMMAEAPKRDSSVSTWSSEAFSGSRCA